MFHWQSSVTFEASAEACFSAMGYFIEFNGFIIIKESNIPRALEIANDMHSDENLNKYASGGSWPIDETKPVSAYKWYSFVKNIGAYTTFDSVLRNWHIKIENSYLSAGRLVYQVSFDSKIGQTDHLLKTLSPVLENTEIVVRGEDRRNFLWKIQDYEFSEREIGARPEEPQEDDDDHDHDHDHGHDE